MAASCYQQDLGAALDMVRREVFAAGDFIKPSSVIDLPDPTSVEDLTEQEEYWEFMGESGTHSILDVLTVIPASSDEQDYGTIRPLSDAEYGELFSTVRPGLADYERLAGTEQLADYVTGGRWTGRAAVLWDNGSPAEIVFWGYSGD